MRPFTFTVLHVHILNHIFILVKLDFFLNKLCCLIVQKKGIFHSTKRKWDWPTGGQFSIWFLCGGLKSNVNLHLGPFASLNWVFYFIFLFTFLFFSIFLVCWVFSCFFLYIYFINSQYLLLSLVSLFFFIRYGISIHTPSSIPFTIIDI